MNDEIRNDAADKPDNGLKEEAAYSTKDGQVPVKPRKPIKKIIVLILVVTVVLGIWAYKNLLPGSKAEDTSEFALDATGDFNLEEILSHGLPVMIDFGADYCAPCREMEPVLRKVNGDYRGRAVIKFVDVQKNPQAAGEFGIKVIPTQFFFDSEGKPYGYHEGFLPEEEIIRILKEIGAE